MRIDIVKLREWEECSSWGTLQALPAKLLTDDGVKFKAKLVEFIGYPPRYSLCCYEHMYFKWELREDSDDDDFKVLCDWLIDQGYEYRVERTEGKTFRQGKRTTEGGVTVKYVKLIFPHLTTIPKDERRKR